MTRYICWASIIRIW